VSIEVHNTQYYYT